MRVSEIEDKLRIFYVSVRRVRTTQVIELMTLACQQLFDPSVSCDSFSIVRILDSRNPGVLLRVTARYDIAHRLIASNHRVQQLYIL